MEFQQIESFVEVAKLLNFSKAAEKLFITQSTMSARIQKLENDLGVPLFVRLGKTIRLSQYGDIFLPYALQCIEIMKMGVHKIVEEKTKTLSKLTISAANPFGSMILPYILPSLHNASPNIQIQVLRNSGYSDEILRSVMEGNIDIGFINDVGSLDGHSNMGTLVIVPLYEDDFVLLSNPSHKLVESTSVTAIDLANSWFILMGELTSISKYTYKYFDLQKLKPISITEMNSYVAIKEMLKKTEMLTFLPRLLVSEDIRKGELAEINLKFPPSPLITFLIYLKENDDSKILEMIREELVSTIDELKLPCRILNS